MIAERGSKMFFVLPAVEAIWAHPDLDALYKWDKRVGAYERRGR